MARSLVVAAALFARVASSSSGDATVLVQAPVAPTPAEMAQGQTKEEESVVSDLLAKPESFFKTMTEEVGNLENEIEKVRQQGQTALSSQQATFDTKLKEQREGNAELERNIESVNDEVSKLTATNRQLWQRSKEIQTENEQHRQELRDMRARIADAAEFVEEQMQDLADANAPEEKVISELDALEGEQKDDAKRKDSMSKIANFGKDKAAMLLSVEEQRESQNLNNDPYSILKLMEDTAANLDAEQKASEAKLKDLFKKKFEAEAAKRARLSDDLNKGTQKRATLSSVLGRLTDAVKHLESIRDRLKQSILSLGAFSEKLGKEHVKKHTEEEKKMSLTEEGQTTFGRKSHNHDGEKDNWLSKMVR